MDRTTHLFSISLGLMLWLMAASGARAVNLIVNSGFDSGLGGWSQTGTVFNTGQNAVLSDQGGSRVVIFQTVSVPVDEVASLRLSFDFLNALSPVVALGQTPDSIFGSAFTGVQPFGSLYESGVYDESIGLLDADYRGSVNFPAGMTISASPKGAGWIRHSMPIPVVPFVTVGFEFIEGNDTPGDSTAAFDNITLIAEPIPEPGVAGVLALAAGVFVLRRRRARVPVARAGGWLAVGLLLLGGAVAAQAQEEPPPPLDPSLVRATAKAERSTLDRTSGVLTSTVDLEVVNTGTQRIDGPVHALVRFRDTATGAEVRQGVTLKDALGGFDRPPHQVPYFDLSPQAADGWMPSEVVSFTLVFSRTRTLNVTYEVSLAGRVNSPPTLDPGGPYAGNVGEVIAFAATASDPDGDPLAFSWDFGDGTTADTAAAEHIYATAGIKSVRVSVDDGRGGVVERDVTALVAPEGDFALAHTRVVDGIGHPRGGATIEETGPDGARSFPATEAGFASLGTTAGAYVWKFSAPGHQPVWRAATLADGEVRLVPSPWLAPDGPTTPVSVLEATVLDTGSGPGSTRLDFPAGAFTQPGDARLTALGPQSLPFPLPTGWSPLTGFAVELPESPAAPGTARLELTDALAAGEFLSLVRYEPDTRSWRLVEAATAPDPAQPDRIAFALAAPGAYAAVVRDQGTGAPLPAAIGEVLPAGTPQELSTRVAAVGLVDPPQKAASTDPAAVTAQAQAVFTPATGVLPSSSWFRIAVQETYDLADGTALRTPDYDATVYAYRRPASTVAPADAVAGSRSLAAPTPKLSATETGEGRPVAFFPLRPQLLFGPADLTEARLHIEVLPPLGDGAAALSAQGGVLQSGDIRLEVPAGALSGFAAGSLRALAPAAFTSLTGPGQSIARAFELNLGGLVDGATLQLSLGTPLAPDTHFALARLVRFPGGSGLAPVQRFRTDASGRLLSAEPASPPRLPGLTGPGQYLLVQLPAPQGLVAGLVTHADTTPAPGIGVRVAAQPWLSVTDTTARYALLAPAGPHTVLASHPTNGDGAASAFTMGDSLDPVALDLTLGALAPRLVATTPPDGATKVSPVTPIVMTFSEALHPATVSPGAVTVTNPHGVVVAGTITLNLSGTVLTFLPNQPLEQAARYTVEIAATVTDRGGAPLEGTRVFTFTVLPFTERPAGAQLVIFEPDAKNIPEAVLNQLVGYNPNSGQSLVVAHGNAGTADPEVPVILVNESTGRTATVLSKTDGSFANFIEASAEDFVSAVFVNAVGARITVPATRQLFDDGRVGLYKQGGILEAESDQGTIEIAIEPDTVPHRSVFQVRAVSLDEIREATGGVLPDNGAFALPGVTISVEGDRPDGDAEISIPIDIASLGLDPSLDPERAPFAATMPMAVDDTVIYVTMDNMRYENGRLITNTCPFKGVYSATAVDNMIQFGANFLPGISGAVAGLGQFIVPILISKKFEGTTINGSVAQLPLSNIDQIEDAMARDLALLPLRLLGGTRTAALDLVGSTAALSEEILVSRAVPVQGAMVALRSKDEVFDGRVKPGIVCAISDANGCYSMVTPALTGKLVATHPRLGRGRDVPIGALDLLDIGTKAFLARNVLFGTPDGVFKNLVPRLAISHTPLNPALGEPVTLQVDAFTAARSPAAIRIGNATAVETLVLGQAVSREDLHIADGQTVEITPGHQRFTTTLVADKALLAKIRVIASSPAHPEFFANPDYLIAFGLSRPPVTNPLVPSDPNDTVKPTVVSVSPPPNHFLFPGQPIEVRFSEPVDRGILTAPDGVSVNVAGPPPALLLSTDQQVLRIHPRQLPASGRITLTVGTSLKDLNSNTLEPAFTADFFVGPLETFDLSGAGNGLGSAGGSLLDGGILYVLDRGALGGVRTFDVSNPRLPIPLGTYTELDASLAPAESQFGGAFSAMDFPRDLALIKNWSHVPGLSGGSEVPAVTKPILAVVGGELGALSDELGNIEEPGQFLTLLDVSDPAKPIQLHNIRLFARPSAVTKIRWSPPNLILLENSADTHFISFIDLQELLIGFSVPRAQRATVFSAGQQGQDLNGDGDYTDPAEKRPYPKASEVTEFFGFRIGYDVLPLPQQRIEDFAFDSGTLAVVRSLSGIAPPVPDSAAPEFRLLLTGGLDMPAAAGFLRFDDGARPKRLTLAPSTSVILDRTPQERNLAFVSLSPDADGVQKLAVIDWTNAAEPRLVRKIEFQESFGLGLGVLQSPELRPDGLLAVSTTTKLVLVDPSVAFSEEGAVGALHPAVLAVLPAGGSGNVSIGQNDFGLRSVALGRRVEVTMSPPSLSFVQAASLPSVADPSVMRVDRVEREKVLAALKEVRSLRPTRYRTQSGVSSTLSPPSPLTHYHVLVRAPGGAGRTIPILLESLNEAGAPLRNKGIDYPPVRAAESNELPALGYEPIPNVDAGVPTLTAYRLSEEETDAAYNLYLSDPIVVVREKMSADEVRELSSDPRRVILWSESLIRASIDVTATGLMGAYGAEPDTEKGIYRPKVVALASTLPGGYVPGSTPPPIGGALAVPGTFGTIESASGEFRHTTADLELPSRRMPIVFERTATNHALVSSGFGRGWDFNYNQRAIELKPELIPPGQREPITERGGEEKNIVAKSLDIILSDGAGNAILFENKGKTPPFGVDNDPLVADLGWPEAGGDFYMPAPTQKGVFDLMYRFSSGEIVRLTPDGTQFRYRSDGRLTKIEDRYPANHHLIEYNADGDLIRIRDLSVTDGREIRLGYYRKSGGGTDFDATIDKVADKPAKIGKICTLRDFAGRVVDFEYDDAGMLLRRLGVEVAGDNDGFEGRPTTTYQLDPRTRAYIGVIAGTGAHDEGSDDSGNALAIAETRTNSQAEAVARNTTGAGGPVSIGVPPDRKASNVGAGATDIGHADTSSTSVSHDGNGYPAAITMRGTGAEPATYETFHNERGLPEHIVYPERNAITYEYEPDTAPFRARGNVRKITRTPGARGGDELVSVANYDHRYNLPSGPQTDFNGKTITINLRGDGRDLESIDYPQAGTHSIIRNEFGQVEEETTVEGIVTSTRYDPSTGYVSRRRMGSLPDTTFDYNGSIAARLGMPTRVIPPRGDAIGMEYDARLQRTLMKRGAAQEEKTGYDENGNVIFLSRALGDGAAYQETRQYSQINFLRKLTVKGVESGEERPDLVTEFFPDPVFRVQSILLPGGELREFGYDHLGNVTSMKLGGYKEAYGRDLHGNMTHLIKGEDEVQEIRYDGHDRPIEIKNKTGTGADEVTSLSYFGKGELKTRTISGPVGGVVADMVVEDVDELGRPLSTKTTGSDVDSSMEIDYRGDQGRTVKTTGPLDIVTAAHDSAGRPESKSDSLRTLTYTPDANGNIEKLTSEENGRPYTLEMTYNGLDQLTKTFDPVGTILEASSLRSDGLVLDALDGRGHTISKRYSRLGELVRLDKPEDIRFAYAFNANRQPASVKDRGGAGNATDFKDGTLRPTATTWRDGSTTSFNDPDGRNLPTTIAIPGGSIAASYDRQGRPLKLDATYSGGNYKLENATYDALGRLRSADYGASGENSLTMVYDTLGPLRACTYDEPGGPYAVSSTIREDGARVTLTYPSGVTVTETRQPSGRLERVELDGALVWHATGFAGIAQPAQVKRGDNIEEACAYDDRRRLLSRRFTGPGGVLLEDMRFRYDKTDNLVARQFIAGGGRADVFEYDPANRLTRAEYGVRPVLTGSQRTAPTDLTGGEGFAAGWFARRHDYAAGGLDLLLGGLVANPDSLPSQLTSASALALPHFASTLSNHDAGFLFPQSVDGFDRGRPDPLGNTARTQLLVRPATGAPALIPADLAYNAHSNLVRITRTDGVTIECAYRPDKLLHHRVVSGGPTPDERALVWHEGRLLEEYGLVPQQTLLARYYYANDDPPVAADLRQSDGSFLRVHYLWDQVLSVVAVTDESGRILERVRYDAWGQPLITTLDDAPPRIAEVRRDGANVLVVMSEPVLPALTANEGNGLQPTNPNDPDAAFRLVTAAGTQSPEVTYLENAPGLPFGSVFRLSPSSPLSGSVTVRLVPGLLVDAWNNSNPADEVSFAFSAGPLLATGAAATGATAPTAVPRSRLGNPWLWQGQWFDYDAGLVYLRARHYDPMTGQFLQRDPMQYQDSVNLYAGMGNNAVSYRDPSGRIRIKSKKLRRIADDFSDPSQNAKHLEETAAAMEKQLAKRAPSNNADADEVTEILDVERLKALESGFMPIEGSYKGNLNFMEFKPEKVARGEEVAAMEGWKLHITADLQSAHRVAEIVLPILRRRDIHHKIVPILFKLEEQLAGSQAGKFITIYTRNSEEAASLVAELDSILLHQRKSGSITPGPRPLDRQDKLIKQGIQQQPEMSFGSSDFIFGMWKHYKDD